MFLNKGIVIKKIKLSAIVLFIITIVFLNFYILSKIANNTGVNKNIEKNIRL